MVNNLPEVRDSMLTLVSKPNWSEKQCVHNANLPELRANVSKIQTHLKWETRELTIDSKPTWTERQCAHNG